MSGTANGGAIYNYNKANLSLINSTISENTAVGGTLGNGIPGGYSGSAVGGAIYNQDSLVTITNTTIVANSSKKGGNDATANGGNLANLSPNSVLIKNSIVANSTGSENCFGVIDDGNNNLQWPGVSCGGFTSADPQLGVLGNNGGSTPTIPLLATSPAIDSANNASCPFTDQRFATRSGGCDIGAFEYSGTACNTPFKVSNTLDTLSCGTLRFAIKVASAGSLIDFVLPIPATINLGSGLDIPTGVTIRGICTASRPGITLDGTGISGNGLKLNGNTFLFGIRVKGFNGRQIYATSSSNRLECTTATKL